MNLDKIYTFIFFGNVGSGKGTQVKLLEDYLKKNNSTEDVLSISTGEEYRKLTERDNYTGQLVKKIIEKGELQPNFLTNSVFTNFLISFLKEKTFLISDGFPRTIEQSKVFENIMKFYQRDEIHIIYMEISKKEAIQRMKLRGRSDDTDEGIMKRFEVYENEVIPSMDYFKDKFNYQIHVINGEQSIEAVHLDIIKNLNL
jgi:adenylate kinase